MNWHYMEGGQAVGPIDDSQFAALVQSRTITLDTLIWRDGMAEWKPYRDLLPSAAAPLKPAMRLSHAAEPAIETDGACSECGTVQPRVNLIPLGNGQVCARCKPLAVQRLRENVTGGGGNYELASMWMRLAARILDAVIVTAGIFVVVFVSALLIGLTASTTKGTGSSPGTGRTILSILMVVVLVISYFWIPFYCLIVMPGRRGGSPGKLICGLRIIRTNGERFGIGWAFLRFLADWLTGALFIGLIFYIIAIFDEQKRTLTDYICGTRVVKTR
jgi:uncharacterized RDD family membrane protein YckC